MYFAIHTCIIIAQSTCRTILPEKFKKYVYRDMQRRQTCEPHAAAKYDTLKRKRASYSNF